MARKAKMPSGMTNRNGTYYSNFRSEGKMVRKKLSTNFQVAKVMLEDLRMRKYRESKGDIDNSALIADLAELWFQSITQQRPASTVRRYRQNMAHILRLIPVRRVESLTLEIVEGFRAARLSECPPNKSTKIKPATVNKDVAVLNQMLNWAVERKIIGSNPIEGMKKLPEQKMEERALEIREARLIFQNSTLHFMRIWYAYFTTGLRKMELANLLFTDIDWESREIIVRATLTKNSRSRRIPIDDILFEILLLQNREADSRKPGKRGGKVATERIAANFSKKHVFVTTTNSRLRNNILRSFKAVCKRCGIETKTYDAEGNLVEVVVLHSLRHSFATDLIRNGADPKSVQELMGHQTIDMTLRIHTKVNSTQKQAAIKKLSYGALLPTDKKISEGNTE